MNEVNDVSRMTNSSEYKGVNKLINKIISFININ